MAAGRRVSGAALSVLLVTGCAHVASRGVQAELSAGKYEVESIRSRAQLDGKEQLLEISEAGTRMVDGNGAEHTLSERGALLLTQDGVCRLALAVSVDGEEPGISDRACTWRVEGDRFVLGDASGRGTRTVYRIQRLGSRVVLEGAQDVDDGGKVVGDARGERIVLVEGALQPVRRAPVDRTSEEQAAREIAESLHDL